MCEPVRKKKFEFDHLAFCKKYMTILVPFFVTLFQIILGISLTAVKDRNIYKVTFPQLTCSEILAGVYFE